MISLLIAATLQSTDFGVRQLGALPHQASARRSTSPGATFSCSVASITDGDTLRCADGTRVRIAGIDAPEISACAANRKCVSGDPQASKRSLANLASGRTLSCRPVGRSYNRVVAFCAAGTVDLSCAQVKAGQAVTRYAQRKAVCR